jgi:phosphohistidine swiveling domain-containing protein
MTQSVVNAVPLHVAPSVVTHLLRQNLLANGDRVALNLAKAEFPALSTDQAIQIFKGEKHFIVDPKGGPGDILLVDDPDSAEWKEELAEAYNGICKIGSGFYKPYGYVVDYGPEDMPKEFDNFDGLSDQDADQVLRRSYATENVLRMMEDHPYAFTGITVESLGKRARHYAFDESDRAVHCKLNIYGDGPMTPLWVLYAEAEEPPFWYEPKTAQQAAETLIFELNVLGYQRTYGSMDLGVEKDLARMMRQAKLNIADTGLRYGNNSDAAKKLEEYILSTKSAEPHHYDERRDRILQQNRDLGLGFRAVDFGAEIGVRDVPNGPLLRWALKRGTGMRDAGPDWQPVSMSGLKQAGDDPIHTDWITGAGLEKFDFSKEPLMSIQNDLAGQIQEETLGFKMHVLVAGKSGATGVVKYCKKNTEVDGNTIAIVANASIHFDRIAREAAAVIVLEGGALSHLAVNGLEMGQVIIRDPEAREKYPEGSVVTIDLVAGRVFKVSDPKADLDNEDGLTPRI